MIIIFVYDVTKQCKKKISTSNKWDKIVILLIYIYIYINVCIINKFYYIIPSKQFI